MMAALLLVGGLLSSCNQEEMAHDGGTPLPDGKYPLRLSASVAEAVQTRTKGMDNWTGDGTEYIAVSVDGITPSTTYKYQITDAGGSTVFADDTQKPFYWQSTTQTANVTAWYPYDNQIGIDITRQDKMDDLSEIDFLKADRMENVNYQTPITLTFRHQMAKVCYTLMPGDGITAGDLASATVSIAGYTQANFSKGTLGGDVDGWITPTSDGEALLVPQNMTDKPFIKVSINGYDFIYTPGAGAADLQPGTRYAYIITVKADAIDVTVDVTGSNEWIAGGEETVTGKTVLVKYAAADVKKGDYIYADGTTSDGGLRTIYTDGSMVSLSGADKPQPVDGKTVAGIVFWTPSETSTVGRLTPARLTDDLVMEDEHPDCTHGLAVAVKKVTYNGSEYIAWQSQQDYVAGFQSGKIFGTMYINAYRFASIGSFYSGSTDNLNKILGYQNTRILLTYNEYHEEIKETDYFVPTVTALAEFEQNANPAPTGSTGWFLPSVKELHILCYMDVDDVYNKNNTSYTYTRNIVNSSLSAAGGDSLVSSAYYWSSTEFVTNYAYFVNFYKAEVVNAGDKVNKKYRVRAVCAF